MRPGSTDTVCCPYAGTCRLGLRSHPATSMQPSTSEQTSSQDWPGLPRTSATAPSSPVGLSLTTRLTAAAQPLFLESESLPNSPDFQQLLGWPADLSNKAAPQSPDTKLGRASPSAATGHSKRTTQSSHGPTPKRQRRTPKACADYAQEQPASRVTLKSASHPSQGPAWLQRSAECHQDSQATKSSTMVEQQRSILATCDRAGCSLASPAATSTQSSIHWPYSEAQAGLQNPQGSSNASPTATGSAYSALAKAGAKIIPLLSSYRALAAQSQKFTSPFLAQQGPALPCKPTAPSPAVQRTASGECNDYSPGQDSRALKPGKTVMGAQALALDLLDSIQQLAGKQHGRILLPGHLQPADTNSMASASSLQAGFVSAAAQCQTSAPQVVCPRSPLHVAAFLDRASAVFCRPAGLH